MTDAPEVRSKLFGKGHAACGEHLSAMLEDMVGCIVRVRDVREDPGRTDRSFRCSCEAPADWFLIELEAVLRVEGP